MRLTSLLFLCLFAFGSAPALAEPPAPAPEAAEAEQEDRTIRVRGDRGQGAFAMSMQQMTRQFRSGQERLAFRNAFNAVFEQHERRKGIRDAYENGELTEADYERERERVYRAMHGMSADEILEAADAIIDNDVRD